MPLPLIYFIRHGLTFANVENIIAGILETPLTPLGHTQAAQAGVFLKDKGLRLVFSSPLIRARQTLAELTLPASLPTQFDCRLIEINCGIFEGKPFSTFPPEQKIENIFLQQTIRRTGGESVADMRGRMRSFIDEHLVSAAGPVLLVGHAASGRALLLELLPPALHAQLLTETIDNASIWQIQNGTYKKVFSPSEQTQFDA